MRKLFYQLLDAFGYGVCGVLRFLRIIPRIPEFDKNSIKKILIIRNDRIGDMILSTPAIRAVRQGFPNAQIHLLASRYTKDLVTHNPNITKILIEGDGKISHDYDLAIALNPGLAQNRLLWQSGARYRVGFTGWGGGFFLTHRVTDDREKRIRHEVESALELASLVGCSTENKSLDISITNEGEAFAEGFLSENNLKPADLVIVIHPGARQKYIRWRKEGFAEVADRLIKENNTKVILMGSKDEEGLVKEVISLMKDKPLVAIGLKLTELVSLIKRCGLFIGNSTGPMHIAAALKVPVVAIFGNIHPLDSYQEWGPWGEGNIVVSKNLNCLHCHPGECRSFDCMRLITAEDVLGAAKKHTERHGFR